MKGMTAILLTLAIFFNISDASAAAASSYRSGGIQWLSNYDEAAKIAQQQQLPLFLFFTGSDWCTWCTRLENEVFDTPEFQSRAGNKFVFVSLDFPMHHQLEPRIASQNQQLKAKYGVSGFPSIVIVDAQGHKIGVSGYRPGGPNRYVDELAAMVDSYQKHLSTLKDLDSNQPISNGDLKELYMKARELGENKEAAAILEKGLKGEDKDNFFLLEKYRITIETGDMHTKEALRMRDKLLTVPSEAIAHAHRGVAIVEFEVLQQRMKRDKLSPAAVVTPLAHYLERFGTQDKDAWRMDMAIAQVYLEGGQPQEALRYALDAQQSAPTKMKAEIDNAIAYIRSQVKE